jgi:hypothetical protein
LWAITDQATAEAFAAFQLAQRKDPKTLIVFPVFYEHFDLNRFRSDMLAEYEKNDKKRFRAIQESRKKYA